jgi:hypothetical protein
LFYFSSALLTVSPRRGIRSIFSSTYYHRNNFYGCNSISGTSRRYNDNGYSSNNANTNLSTTATTSIITKLLPYKEERHKSIHIHITDDVVVQDTSSFLTQLQATVESAQAMGKLSVWIHIPMHRSSLMEAIATSSSSSSLNFQYHHAHGTIASLYLWLPQHQQCTIPPFATHHVVRY